MTIVPVVRKWLAIVSVAINKNTPKLRAFILHMDLKKLNLHKIM